MPIDCHLESALRSLVDHAWRALEFELALELEAIAYRRYGINLDAERRARLDAVDKSRRPAAE